MKKLLFLTLVTLGTQQAYGSDQGDNGGTSGGTQSSFLSLAKTSRFGGPGTVEPIFRRGPSIGRVPQRTPGSLIPPALRKPVTTQPLQQLQYHAQLDSKLAGNIRSCLANGDLKACKAALATLKVTVKPKTLAGAQMLLRKECRTTTNPNRKKLCRLIKNADSKKLVIAKKKQ